MSSLGESLMKQEDYRARRVGQQIDKLDDLRRQGFRHTEISIDAYEQLLLENMSLQLNQRAQMKAFGDAMATRVSFPMPQRGSTPLIPTVDTNQDPMINCDHCHGQHLAGMLCPFDPANQQKREQ